MKIHTQSVFDKWLMPDKSIQVIITSPPYWGLRKYDIPDCKVIKGQYGLEPSYKEYVEHTRLWAKEAWRVLRDSGIMFLNLGDSYGTVSGNMGRSMTESKLTNLESINIKQPNINMHKCKILIPHRIAIALIDDGWILRNDIVWFKPNAMPESCQDRFSKKFEFIFMFSKKEKYYFDLDAVREAHKDVSLERVKGTWNGHKEPGSSYAGMDISKMCHENGKTPGDLWQFNTQPSPFKHYAMWPEKLVRRMILCSTKAGDTVLDPFCGSGTTLRMAESLKRTGTGIDLGYQDIQEQRLKHIQEEMYV